MVFVQSLRGLSHTKLEDTKPEHLELSVRALDRWRRRALAGRGLTEPERRFSETSQVRRAPYATASPSSLHSQPAAAAAAPVEDEARRPRRPGHFFAERPAAI